MLRFGNLAVTKAGILVLVALIYTGCEKWYEKKKLEEKNTNWELIVEELDNLE
mgnify:CR=1 FL=1